MRFKALLGGVGAALAAATLAATAAAGTIVDTGYSSTTLPLGGGEGPPTSVQFVGVQNFTYGEFRVTGDTRITAAAFYGSVQTGGELWLRLYADDGLNSDRPGTLLYWTTFTVASGGGAWRGASGFEWDVIAGRYWIGLGAEGDSTATAATHWGNAPNGLGNEAIYSPLVFPLESVRDADGANLAWRIEGDAVVDGGGGDPGVPEPGTWALLIAGFGLTGAALRRRAVAAEV